MAEISPVSITLAEVEAWETQRCAAMVAGDVQSLGQLFSPDLVWIHSNGEAETGSSMIARFADGRLKVHALARSPNEVRASGRDAIVTGEVEMDVEIGGARQTIRSRYEGSWSTATGTPLLMHWKARPLA